MKRLLLVITLVLVALVPLGAQTFSGDVQVFWGQLRTGAIAFSTGRVQTSGYMNFGNSVGANGYGFRDLAGVMQFKDSGGAWSSFPSGGLAPAAATYLLQTANASLPSAQAMGALGTGLVLNATATGVQSIYAGTSCTNQFPRSLSAVGATAATQCRVAFTFAAGTEWDCAASDDTTTVAVRTTPVDTTHTDLIGTFTAGDKVTGICFPR